MLASVEVLNKAYLSTGVSFTLVNTTRTLNPSWFHDSILDNVEAQQMKLALRFGGAKDLNIYSVGYVANFHENAHMPIVLCRLTSGGGVLGYASPPINYQRRPERDGVGAYIYV